MTTQTFDVPSPLERLVTDRRVVIGALIAGALIIICSLVVANFSQAPSRARALKSVAVLPDAPLNIPIMRQWPYPAPKVETVRAPGGKVVAKRNVVARR
ncbi:MAG: hypothetical protein Q8N23_31380 [Archangium sp.]|nr:hypothetical protein [Archangium sp.]MDP3576272.1 hypothetical protein [Archangium sp.]